tara:strand:- start:417 stop:575 length:159 start_codon:yes stop_codon:yes gene_type:complete
MNKKKTHVLSWDRFGMKIGGVPVTTPVAALDVLVDIMAQANLQALTIVWIHH